MPTLNQYASRVANILGRQADHALLERVKDAFKDIFATRIRQSISRSGIDNAFVISCELPIVIDNSTTIKDFKIFKTTSKVPVPVRFNNDAPFTFVGIKEGISFSHRTLFEIIKSSQCDVKGFLKYYTYGDGFIRVFILTKYSDLELSSTTFEKIIIKSIFENPEEVISIMNNVDSQTAELPFPSDMLESILQELLKTEFGYVAPEVEIKS